MSQTRNNNAKQQQFPPAFGFPVQRGQEKPSTPPIQAQHEYNGYPSYDFSVPQLQIQQASSGRRFTYAEDLSAPLLKLSISEAEGHQAAGEAQMKGLLSSQLEETRRSPTAGVHELSPRFDAVVRDQRRTPEPIGTIGKKSPMPQSSLEVPPPAYGKGLSLSPPNTVTLFQSSSHKSAQFIRSISPSTLQPSPMISPSTSPHRLSPLDPSSSVRYALEEESGFNEEFLNGMGGMDDVDDHHMTFRGPPLLTPHRQVPVGVVAPMPIKRPSPTTGSLGSFGSGSLDNQFDMNSLAFSYGYSSMEFAPQEDSVFQKPSSVPNSEIDAPFLSSPPSGASQDPNTYLEHPLGEHPSRTLFVRNISSNVDDEQLKDLFGSYGPIRSLYTQCKHRGFVMISYYDIRHAKNAMKNLQHKIINRRKIDIHYSIPKENPSEKDLNQGTLVVFNLDPSITNEELKKVFGKFGEIKEIRETPNKKHHKFIEFYDVRDAERAMKHLNKTELKGKKIKIEPSRPGGARRNLSQDGSTTSSPVLESSLSESPSMMTMPIVSSSPSYTHFGSPVQLIQKPAPSLLSMVHQQQMQQFNPMVSGSPILEQYSSSHGALFGNQIQGQHHPMFQGTPPSSRFASSLPSSLSAANPIMNGSSTNLSSTQPFTISPAHNSPTVIVARSPPAASSSSAPIVSAEPAAESPVERTKQRKGNSDKKLFSVDLERVRHGDDKRTTLMIKNIPNKYTQKMLLQTIEIKFKATFDFFYLPIDFKNKCNVGYAFINFINPINIVPFSEEFHGKKWEKFNSEKICEITYARIQGKTALISHFQNSSLMVEDPSCRPIFI